MWIRWLVASCVVIAAIGVDARAEAPYSCYTIRTKLRPEPQARCAQDCDAERESEKQFSPLELGACTPATTSVWCMYGVGNYEQCFADRNVCIASSPSNTVAKATGKPMREDVCTEKGTIAPASTTPTEPASQYSCYSQKSLFDNAPIVYCEVECERHLADAKDGAPETTKFTNCVPATGNVWCTTGFGPMMRGEREQCFADHERCLHGNKDNVAAEIEGRPIDTTVCIDKGPTAHTATATVAATASTPDGNSVDDEHAAAPAYEGNPHHFMVYGSVLSAGEEPDNTTGGALGIEHRSVGDGTLSYAIGFDAVGHYTPAPRGFGGYGALRAGVGGQWGTGSAGFTVGFGYGGIERSAAEIPFEVFLNGSIAGVGVLLRYEQVHRFVDNAPMTDARFMNASGFSAWVVLWGKALDPRFSIGFRVQSRDDTDAAFFNVALGASGP